MESAVSYAPLRPADFVNFAGRGGAGRPSLVCIMVMLNVQSSPVDIPYDVNMSQNVGFNICTYMYSDFK